MLAWEKQHLRELAKRQLEIARLPVMEERKKMWFNVNKGKTGQTPVVIESWTFGAEMMPEDVLKCESASAREIEYGLLKNIREFELIGDDKVMPDYVSTRIDCGIDVYGGIEMKQDKAAEPGLAYQYKHPLEDLADSIHLYTPAEPWIDRAASKLRNDEIEDTLGDILPLVHEGKPYSASLTQAVVHLMGMEGFFMAMYDAPDELHTLMGHISDAHLKYGKFMEKENLLCVHNGNQDNGPSTYSFTDELPSSGFTGTARLSDIWLWFESQETVGVSPDLFCEFCLPYYKKVAEPIGLVYWGCCEPVHVFYEDILKAVPQVRKFSISPWCDEKLMGERLTGSGIIYSRKPSPLFLGGGDSFDADGWRKHISETESASKNCAREIIIRDVYKVNGLDNAKRAVAIAREEMNK